MTDKNADAFRTISEAAEELDLPQHVLRFWETRFSQIRPMKRTGGRRYYRPQDIELLSAIRHLLYAEGYTIKGVQRILKQEGVAPIIALVDRLRADRTHLSAAAMPAADVEPRVRAEPPSPSEPSPMSPRATPVESSGAVAPANAPATIRPDREIARIDDARRAMAHADAMAHAHLAADLRAALTEIDACLGILASARAGAEPLALEG